MAKASLKTHGFDEYIKALEEQKRILPKAAADACVAGAKVAETGMVARVPKDERDLEKEIKVGEPVINANEVSVEVGILNASKEIQRYGMAQEFGTSSMRKSSFVRTMKKDKNKIRQAQVESLKKDGIL